MKKRSPVATELKRLRLRADLTQQQLADRAGTSRELVCRLEAGRPQRTSTGTIDRLARALGVPVSALYTVPTSLAETPIEPFLARFLASPQGKSLSLEEDEIQRLRAAGPLYWLGLEPTDDTFTFMVLALRKAKKKPKSGK